MDTVKDTLPAAAALPAGYAMQEGYPLLSEYLNLRKATGLTPVTPEQGSMVSGGSWYGVYITVPAGEEDDSGGNGHGSTTSTSSGTSPQQHTTRETVAMGRIISDGGWYFIIADVAVLPAHQRRGLGDAIVKTLVARVRSHGAKGHAFISLSADPPGRKLYERNGFRDAMPAGMGMNLRVQVPGEGGDVEKEAGSGGSGGGSR